MADEEIRSRFSCLLDAWIRSIEMKPGEFDSEFEELAIAKGKDARASWKLRTPRNANQEIVFQILGVEPNEFWRGPREGSSLRVDPVQFDEKSCVAHFRGRRVRKQFTEPLLADVEVGKQFWDFVKAHRDAFRQGEIMTFGVSEFLGVAKELVEARPARIKVGQVVALATHLDLWASELPLTYDIAAPIDELMQYQIGWPGPLAKSKKYQLVFENKDTDLVEYCSLRNRLHRDSVLWVEKRSGQEREELAAFIEVNARRLREAIHSGAINAAIAYHVALHVDLLPPKKKLDGKQILSKVLPPATSPCVMSDEHKAISNSQHAQLVGILIDQFSSQKLERWYATEHAFCVSNCLQQPVDLRI